MPMSNSVKKNIIDHLVPPFVDVQLAGPLRVDRVPLVWVDHHTAATINF